MALAWGGSDERVDWNGKMVVDQNRSDKMVVDQNRGGQMVVDQNRVPGHLPENPGGNHAVWTVGEA